MLLVSFGVEVGGTIICEFAGTCHSFRARDVEGEAVTRNTIYWNLWERCWMVVGGIDGEWVVWS